MIFLKKNKKKYINEKKTNINIKEKLYQQINVLVSIEKIN